MNEAKYATSNAPEWAVRTVGTLCALAAGAVLVLVVSCAVVSV